MDNNSASAPSKKSWSIHTRPEITQTYKIQNRIGSGTYSDVYVATRKSDNLKVALKEIHDYQSAHREIQALQLLQGVPNVVEMIEYFWSEDEDAVVVLEYLEYDLGDVIRDAKRNNGGELGVGEVKSWMVQVLRGVDGCHRRGVVHRDLKPGNLLVGDDGVLKVADFGQARILMEPEYGLSCDNVQPYDQDITNKEDTSQPHEFFADRNNLGQEGEEYVSQEQETLSRGEHLRELVELKARGSAGEIDKEANTHDGDTSCLATGTASDFEEDPLKGSYYYDMEKGDEGGNGAFTSCVGTRWFRAPELLYGSTNYGLEIDLWSLGCIFAELLNLNTLFRGESDIDQLSRIFNVLGNLTENVWPECSTLPDYNIISFNEVENPKGLEACLPNRSPDEISIVKKLLTLDPASRATAAELLQEKYFYEEPLPVPVNELRVPLTRSSHNEDSTYGWHNYNEMGSDSDFDDFGPVKVTTSSSGFSIQFS